MANKLQLKHNKNEDFNIENYTNVILAKSEPLYDTVHKKLYIGDGKTVLSNLTAINVMSDLDAETIINLINNNDQNLKINADRVNISKTIGEETKDYKLSERFDNNGNAIRSVETLKIVDGENNNNFYTYSSLRAAIDAGGSGAGEIDPTGPTGPAGTSITVKATALECTQIGDGYINNKDGHLMILTSTDPRTFTDGGQIKGDTGDTGPMGPTGPAGTSITVKATALECTKIGDGYINNEDGHLMVLTSTDPRIFTDGGQIKGDTGPMGPSGKDGRDGVDGVGREGPTGPRGDTGTVSANSGTNLPTTANEGDIFFLYVVS